MSPVQVLNLPPLKACVLLAVAGLVAVTAILAYLLQTGLAWRLATDVPNDRSLHIRPTPRVGGWGIVPVVMVLIWLSAPELWMSAAVAGLLAALSQIDDRCGLPARMRFTGHLVAVVSLVFAYRTPVPWWELALIAFLLLWLVNLYNFMDGADGLAGGMALFGFGGYAYAALSVNYPDVQLAAASAVISGAVAGFLLFNFHPARVFLGDAGSIPLGFLAGALGYWGWRGGVWPVWFPALTFAPFIGDASVTLLKRLWRGERFWHAHREHYYQRMVRSGLGHATTALIWYWVMVAGIMLAIVALRFSPFYQWMAVFSWALVLVAMGYWVDRRWRGYVARSTLPKGLDANDQT
ncbi:MULTISPECIES: MraY family glycosyltransferase [Mycetohabitans]|uniref:UDP-N-acetylmuramyl pentapeptide phosphotransferase/UDP-N-acetylglucosamine-1-phosphate transferase n=1 Tax=Mycetohabitans endofungorum TaxID=417203 RepID=A0A2P5KCH2_9BURK|nr:MULTISPECIES: glycosyltransferase family 4 protein [Mycetohabitans]PPB84417.1 UDP-N-acetylmuramyl pentapeptide phosphotransferase/UDP-N-acetylglucosamine-1-phosphate transferase [Mycetohabitans endofungorum]